MSNKNAKTSILIKRRRLKIGSGDFVQLSAVTLTKAEANAFFSLLAMSTAEPSDVDFDTLLSIEQKFCAARK